MDILVKHHNRRVQSESLSKQSHWNPIQGQIGSRLRLLFWWQEYMVVQVGVRREIFSVFVS